MKYINKIENRITFKIKPEYYLELLTPETMKLVGSTISTIRSKWCKCAYLEVNEVVLIQWNIVNNVYRLNSSVLYTFVPNNYLINYKIFHPKTLYFSKYLTQNFCILKYGLLIKILNR